MIALDTNVLARYLLKDDPTQYRAVVALLGRRETFTAPATVMQKLVWVLSVNDCGRGEIARGLAEKPQLGYVANVASPPARLVLAAPVARAAGFKSTRRACPCGPGG